MKEGIHPNYREVLFHDVSNDFKFVTRSTIQTKDTIEHEGKTYPLAKIEVSSESHPFYTGQQKIMDTAGRVEKFNQRFKNFGGSSKEDIEQVSLWQLAHCCTLFPARFAL